MIFRKYLQPEELGRRIYERLRSDLESKSNALNLDELLFSLFSSEGRCHEQASGEIVVAVMFAAVLAIERSTTPSIAQRIIGGMKGEFLSHLHEQGASGLQQAEWEVTMAGRFLGYREALDGYSGYEPPWKLGREFYWNLTDSEEYVALSIKIATLYLLAARDVAQELLNSEGPFLMTGGPSGRNKQDG